MLWFLNKTVKMLIILTFTLLLLSHFKWPPLCLLRVSSMNFYVFFILIYLVFFSWFSSYFWDGIVSHYSSVAYEVLSFLLRQTLLFGLERAHRPLLDRPPLIFALFSFGLLVGLVFVRSFIRQFLGCSRYGIVVHAINSSASDGG